MCLDGCVKCFESNWAIGKLPPPPPLVTVAPSDKQTELLTYSESGQRENLVLLCFCTILDTEGRQMVIKYSMEGFIKYLIINTMGNSKRVTDHKASWRSLILWSVIMIADDNMHNQHVYVSQGINECTFEETLKDLRLCLFDLHCTRRDQSVI